MIGHIDTLSTAQWLATGCTLALLIGAMLGVYFCHRSHRRKFRDLQRTLANRELALLDARRDHVSPEGAPHAFGPSHPDALLTVTLQQLDEARTRSRSLDAALEAQERHHALTVARLKLAAIRAQKQGRAQQQGRTRNEGARVVDGGAATASLHHAHQGRRRGVADRRVARRDRRVRHAPVSHDQRATHRRNSGVAPAMPTRAFNGVAAPAVVPRPTVSARAATPA